MDRSGGRRRAGAPAPARTCADRTFADRSEAGEVLAGLVTRQLDLTIARVEIRVRPLVLALPRGGVPVARPVARALGAELDLVVARKIGVPEQPELGVGAVTATGPPLFDPVLLRALRLTEDDLADIVQRQREEARRQLRRFRGDRPAPEITGRLVVVVDDGLATGVTARSALRELRGHDPAYLVFAAPVCAEQSVPAVAAFADAVLCACQPPDFRAVGRWYRDFSQLTDDDVTRELSQALAEQANPGTDPGTGPPVSP